MRYPIHEIGPKWVRCVVCIIMDAPFTLSFANFWSWLVAHPNCVLRMGTPEVVIYDDEDLHWHFANRTDDRVLVQLLRGKRLMSELFVECEQIAYVQVVPGENEDEHVFELIAETEASRTAAYFFVLGHGYEKERTLTAGRVH